MISKKVKLGDSVKVEVTPKNFGRIAASTGKNILWIDYTLFLPKIHY